jgi:hypothetical protein
MRRAATRKATARAATEIHSPNFVARVEALVIDPVTSLAKVEAFVSVAFGNAFWIALVTAFTSDALAALT